MKSILLISLIISLASLGFRAITSKGMVFYFLRKPFDKLSDRKKNLIDHKRKTRHNLVTLQDVSAKDRSPDVNDEILKLGNELQNIGDPLKYDWLLYIMKPFILCSTCMASVHTLVWYPIITGGYKWPVILVMLIVATLNTLIWAYIEKIK